MQFVLSFELHHFTDCNHFRIRGKKSEQSNQALEKEQET